MKVEIEGDNITVRISSDTIKTATEHCPQLGQFNHARGDFEGPKVTDIHAWCRAVLRVLNAESEDGSTLMTRVFDKAFLEAVEAGAEGIEIPGVLD
jgi:hypothetical protein